VNAIVGRAARRLWSGRAVLLFAVPAASLLVGLAGAGLGARAVASAVWIAVTLLGLVYSTVTILMALRRRRPWMEAIAWLALAGALLVGESLTGAVIAVMLFTAGVLRTRTPARRDRTHGTHRDPDPTFAALPGDAWLSPPTVLPSQS
jgi:cation transport ATPase